ncbi:MAG: Hsp20/alpha crystallin family protein [Deltaproteobacteria bacterium]|jgi:HSP20 family protein
MNELTTTTTPNQDIAWATPSADIFEGEAEYLLALDLPGVKKDAVDVQIEEGNLSVQATRGENGSALRYRRTFRLGPTVDTSALEAKLEHGVLTVHIPKMKKQTVTVPVSVS